MIFALELTHDLNALPAFLIASVVAYGMTVLVMKHSILTEKVARHGYHITREYAIDPLERLSIGTVMTTEVVAAPAALPVRDLLGHTSLAAADETFGIPRRRQGREPAWRDYSLGSAGALAHRPDRGSQDAAVLGESPIIAYDLIEEPPVAGPTPTNRVARAAERMASAGCQAAPRRLAR